MNLRYVARRLVGTFVVACGIVMAPAHAEGNHYFDPAGNALPEYESIYPELQALFGDKTPERFVVEKAGVPGPDYDPQKNRILLPRNFNADAAFFHTTMISAWGAIAKVTDNANLRMDARFFTAGLQPLFCEKVSACAANLEPKRLVLNMVAGYRQSGLLTFDKAKDFKSFSDQLAGATKNGGASFAASSSFFYFLMDTYGKDSVMAFLAAMATNKDINAVCQASLKKDAAAIEKGWSDYLGQLPPPAPAPKVVRMVPENGATNVPVGPGEIEVEFDQPMAKSFSLVTKRNQGVSYEDGYWKNDHVRTFKVNLLPNHEYSISINSNEYRGTANVDGVQLPPTPWTFKTGEAH